MTHRLTLYYAITLVTGLLAFAPFPLRGQDDVRQVDPQLLAQPWNAHWITHPTESGTEFGVFHFRRVIDLADVPDSFVIHVSADPRYRLFVNGVSVAVGPAVGDQSNWRFTSVDIADQLRPGRNALAATVWNFGEHRPLSHHSYRTAFLIQGSGEREAAASTGAGWKVAKDDAYQPIPVSFDDVGGYFAASPGERFQASAHPWGWKDAEFDDSEWADVEELFPGTPSGTNPYGNLYGWSLVPRQIPMMEENQTRLAEIRRSEGIDPSSGFLRGRGQPLKVPPYTKAVILLDQGHLTNAYPVLITSAGRDARIKLTYAESLRNPDNTKGNRNEVEGKHILGLHDLFITDGGEQRQLQPLWLRTYRYIQLEIETANQPLQIHDMHGIFTGYPFEENAEFSSSDASLEEIWDVGWRTARLNAFESYWDCPYYEQLQYIGDTRIQALISLYVSGDDRLMRKALRHFDQSRSPEGITMSRYPSRHPQYIPPYSLLWIPMVHDYWMHRHDDAFVQQFLPGIRSVIGWFERHLDEDTGLLGPMAWWNYVDATRDWQRGVPPDGDEGGSIVITLQMLYAIDHAIELAEHFGHELDAEHYRELQSTLRQSIRAKGWDPSRQLFADTADHDSFSQHANILAILANLLNEDEEKEVMRRVMEDESLTQATYYFKFYLFRALIKAGLGNEYLTLMDPWYRALELGMTTFPEHPEPSRSDAHAWSSSPNYDFLATVAGIVPDAPGFASVLIEPHPGDLEWIDARVPHPQGAIEVDLSIDGERISGKVTLPKGVDGRFSWRGSEVPLTAGSQSVELPQ